jgi:hypothetical protein
MIHPGIIAAELLGCLVTKRAALKQHSQNSLKTSARGLTTTLLTQIRPSRPRLANSTGSGTIQHFSWNVHGPVVRGTVSCFDMTPPSLIAHAPPHHAFIVTYHSPRCDFMPLDDIPAQDAVSCQHPFDVQHGGGIQHHTGTAPWTVLLELVMVLPAGIQFCHCQPSVSDSVVFCIVDWLLLHNSGHNPAPLYTCADHETMTCPLKSTLSCTDSGSY